MHPGHSKILSLFFIGSKARGEGIEASERHPGGEGECQPAQPAAARLQQRELLPEQPGAN